MNLNLHYRHGGNRHALYKFLLVMKLIVILITTAIMQVSASSFAQKITLNKNSAPLSQIINEIRVQSGYDFFYNKILLKSAKPVTIKVQNASIEEVLEICFKNQPLEFQIAEKTVMIKEKEKSVFENIIDRFQAIDVAGKVTDEDGVPLSGANIRVKGSSRSTVADAEGKFTLVSIADDAILMISFIGYENIEIRVAAILNITLKVSPAKLDEISVVSTGYQTLPKERATGSFAQIDNKLFNRQVSPDVISRLKGIAPSLLFDERSGSNKLNIRGISTIFANDQPLIVLDNFPYTGDLSNINPNDIEDVTILRDAAAASIWGVRAGNGVIVITSKKGKFNQDLAVNFNSNVTIGDKPNLFYQPRMSVDEFINVETELFDLGYFESAIQDVTMPSLSPLVEILIKKKNGELKVSEADEQINLLRSSDMRKDLEKYFYRNNLNQQYALNISGSSNKHAFYFSTGYDNVRLSETGNSFGKLNLNFDNTFHPFANLDVTSKFVYTQNWTQANSIINSIRMGAKSSPLYTKLADDNGKGIAVTKDYRQLFASGASSNGYLDWEFNPLNELGIANKKLNRQHILANTNLSYMIVDGLKASILYQYETQEQKGRDNNSIDSYFARNLINRYTTPGSSPLQFNIPKGDIYSFSDFQLTTHNFRSQIGFDKSFQKHNLSAIGGFEVRQTSENGFGSQFYGYDSSTGGYGAVNYNQDYVVYPAYYIAKIPNDNSTYAVTDRFRSYYVNIAYDYRKKYTFSASGRIDQSNLFGVERNLKSRPLWSLGAMWNVWQESYFDQKTINALKLRITYGYSGNIDNTTTAYTTARYGTNSYTLTPAAYIISPPNRNLGWEKISTLNFGIDYGILNNRISGSIDYYQKKGMDLIGQAPIDPTSGVSSFKGNVASTRGTGLDLALNTENIIGTFVWKTSILLSKSNDKVTKYELKPLSIYNNLSDFSAERSSFSYSPIVGKPLFGVYSLPSAGLDPSNGNPQGYLNGKISTDYSAIFGQYTVDSLQYHGSAIPTTFGSVRNTFEYKGLSLSFNLTYRLGYYFKRNSIFYNDLYTTYTTHSDFKDRWQKPGDEIFTTVPSMIYPAVPIRDDFYRFSNDLVEKGDNIRVQDIQLGYKFRRGIGKAIKQLEIYSYINNVGIIWRANKHNLDPDIQFFPTARTYSLGVKLGFQ